MRRRIFKRKFKSTIQENRPDYILMITTGILVILGLFILSSASSVFSYQRWGNAYHLVIHQIIYGLIPGIILFLLLLKINYHFWEKYYLIFLIISLVLLVLVFIPGIGVSHGRAKSWVQVFNIIFQPAEVVKLTLILFLAGWFSKKGYINVRSFFYGFLPFVLVFGMILGLIAKQPDIGTMIIVAVIGIGVYFIAGARISHLATLAAAGSAVLVLLVIKSSYLANRLIVFFNPASDTQGIGYHVYQALLAIGSGGLFGRGFGKSQQKFAYLPEVSNDSIFAVATEEMGFIAGAGLVILFLIFTYRAMRIAQNAPDPYGRLVATGIICWFAFQAFFNMAVMIKLAPLTGIPLPFISYGGTALATSLGALGILLNISKQTVNV